MLTYTAVQTLLSAFSGNDYKHQGPFNVSTIQSYEHVGIVLPTLDAKSHKPD